MQIALLGYEQAGKKTLFSLLTGREASAARRDDESITGISRIRDPRVDGLARICKPKKTTYAENCFVLCPNVSVADGKRLWLDAAKRTDLICLVVREFTDDAVYHPAGSVNATRDLAELETELVFADLELVDKRLERIAKEKRSGQTAEQKAEEQVLTKVGAALGEGARVDTAKLTQQEESLIRSLGLLTLKPVLRVRNVSEDALANADDGDMRIACEFELEIGQLEDDDDRAAYMADLGVAELGVHRMNRAAYSRLGLMSFYTMGPDEARAWTIRKGTLAPAAGGKIHSDIERGFIRVEVMPYADLERLGSEDAVKAEGKMQLRGRDYEMQDGDVCHFLFNV